MKRLIGPAVLAMLGVGLVGYVTLVYGQTPPSPLPPALPPAVPESASPMPTPLPATTLPPAPTVPTSSPPAPTLPPAPAVPMSSPPAPKEVAPTAPAPIALPGAPALPAPSDFPTPAPVVPQPTGPAGPAGVRPAMPAGAPANRNVTVIPANQPMTENPNPERNALPDDASSSISETNPTGRQEPAVSIEWLGPAVAKLGQATDYTIAVRNVCNIPVQQVMVRVRIAAGVTVAATEPKAIQEDNVLMWEIGTMLPKQERNLQLRMVPANRGDPGCQAWVTFTGATAMKIRVREPKLLIKATAPEKVWVGDACTFVLTVSNPGDFPAENVKIHTDLSEGLEHARGNKINFDLGHLAPGDTRSVQVVCGTKAGGEQKCEAFAEAEGGLKATDKAVANVLMPQIKIEVVSAPKLRYLDRKAKYVFKVVNPGDAPASNVVVHHVIPAGFKFLGADNGGRHDFTTRTVTWFIGELSPGQSREVGVEAIAVNQGEHQHKVTAQAARGLKVETDAVTRVEGLSAIMIEVVDLEDPVEVGADTIYEIRITNTGSKTETGVKLVCTIPGDKMQFKSATGPSRFHQEGTTVIFEPLPKLAPRADAVYRVTVKTTAPGIAQFKAQITSAILVDPVTKEEATRVYAD